MSYYEKPEILLPKRKVLRNHRLATSRMRIASVLTSACNCALARGLVVHIVGHPAGREPGHGTLIQ